MVVFAFTISAWVFPTAYDDGCIVRKGTLIPSPFNFFMNTDGTLGLRAGHTVQTGAWRTVETLSLATWHHVAVTWAHGSEPVFFIDGSAAVTTEIDAADGDPAPDDEITGQPVQVNVTVLYPYLGVPVDDICEPDITVVDPALYVGSPP